MEDEENESPIPFDYMNLFMNEKNEEEESKEEAPKDDLNYNEALENLTKIQQESKKINDEELMSTKVASGKCFCFNPLAFFNFMIKKKFKNGSTLVFMMIYPHNCTLHMCR